MCGMCQIRDGLRQGARAEIRERLYVVDQDAKTQGAKEALREGE